MMGNREMGDPIGAEFVINAHAIVVTRAERVAQFEAAHPGVKVDMSGDGHHVFPADMSQENRAVLKTHIKKQFIL